MATMNTLPSKIIALFLILSLWGCAGDSSSPSAPHGADVAGVESQTNPLIRPTQSGLVEGLATEGTYAWLGIPYAQAPVGPLRWRAPQAPAAWEGVRPAQGFCRACPQYGGLMGFMDPDTFGVPVGGEDCLYLNIWRPATNATGLPVLFWIHGGGNFSGQANLPMYHGAHFAACQDITFVSVNYRLGVMGWFTHPALRSGDASDASGNYGTLDLIQALTWVKRNIAAFGGDPENVTIAGQSAGAVNVFSLLVSPRAAGLFQRAIAQSGGPGSTSLSAGDQVSAMVLDKLCAQDGIGAGDPRRQDPAWIADYLRRKPWRDIYACFTPGLAGMLGGGWSSIFADGAVIPGDAATLIKQGAYTRVPLIFGNNRDEAKIFLPLVVSKLGEGGEPVEKAFQRLIMDFDPDHPDLALSDVLDPVWVLLYDPLADAVDWLARKASVDSLAPYLACHQRELYVYEFAWDEEPAPLDTLIGAGHAIEIPFAFDNFGRSADDLLRFAWSTTNQANRERLSRVMMGYWAQFARTGDPNTPGGYPWRPWSNAPLGYKRVILDSELNCSPPPAPPGRPAMGWGSPARYLCERFATVKLSEPDGTAVWYYVPERLRGARAPVIIVLHGFSQTDPAPSMGQIRHYVRQGAIVIFPQYGLTGMGFLQDLDQNVMLARAIKLTHRALADIGDKADHGDVLIVGHSLGGGLALCWTAAGGIAPRGLILQNPSILHKAIPDFVEARMTFLDYQAMGPAVTCPVILFSAEEDGFAPLEDQLAAYQTLTHAASKVLYLVHSDYHGQPGLTADHCAPLLIGCSIPKASDCPLGDFMENALDTRVYYAATDALLDGQARPGFDLGTWSDGTPVKPVETILP